MRDLVQVFTLLLYSFYATRALPWEGPAQTLEYSAISSSPGCSPKPTEGPDRLANRALLRRVESIPDTVCGWAVGYGYSEYDIFILSLSVRRYLKSRRLPES